MHCSNRGAELADGATFCAQCDLSAAWFALYFVLVIFSAILSSMLWRVMWMLDSLLGFAFFLLWVFQMYKAYNKEEFKLPVIGDLAAKQA